MLPGQDVASNCGGPCVPTACTGALHPHLQPPRAYRSIQRAASPFMHARIVSAGCLLLLFMAAICNCAQHTHTHRVTHTPNVCRSHPPAPNESDSGRKCVARPNRAVVSRLKLLPTRTKNKVDILLRFSSDDSILKIPVK